MKRRALAAVCSFVLAACGLDLIGSDAATTTTPGTEAGAETSRPRPSDDLPDTGAPDAPCTDTRSDGANCGACGHSCLGATCREGICAPEVLVAFLRGPHAVALDPANAYIAEHAGGLLVATGLASFDGGKGTEIFDTTQAPRALAFANGRLYWVEQHKIRSVTTDGKNHVESGIGGGSAVVIDGNNVFYNDIDGSRIMQSDLGLNGVETIAEAQTNNVGIAVDSHNVYWTHNTNGASVSQRMREAETPSSVVVASNEDRAESIVVDPARLYWTTKTAIRSLTIDSGAAPQTLYAGEELPRSLLRDGPALYWIDAKGGTIRRGATDGSAALTLAKDQGQETDEGLPLNTALAVDAYFVYWVTSATGTLKRVAK